MQCRFNRIEKDTLGKMPRIRLLSQHNQRDRVASEREYQLPLAAVRPDIRDILEVLWEQGRRESEFLNMQRSQVDWVTEELVFPINTTKRKDSSVINPDLGGVLEEIHTCPGCGRTGAQGSGRP